MKLLKIVASESNAMEPILVMPKRKNAESGCNRDLSDKDKSSNCASRVSMKESIDPR